MPFLRRNGSSPGSSRTAVVRVDLLRTLSGLPMKYHSPVDSSVSPSQPSPVERLYRSRSSSSLTKPYLSDELPTCRQILLSGVVGHGILASFLRQVREGGSGACLIRRQVSSGGRVQPLGQRRHECTVASAFADALEHDVFVSDKCPYHTTIPALPVVEGEGRILCDHCCTNRFWLSSPLLLPVVL